MAWVDIGERAALVEGSTTRGWAHFEYDNASGTTTRRCRIRIEARSGHTFSVMFRNITVAGVNRGTVTGVTQSSGTIWSDDITAGRNVTASWENPWNVGTKYPSVSGYLPSSGTAPTGGSVTFNSSTWNTINATSGVTSWGGLTGNIHLMVVTGETNGDADSYTSYSHARREFHYNGTSSTSYAFSATDSSTSAMYDGTPLSIKGLLHYKLGYYNYNSVGNTSGIDNTIRYLPPAPGQFSYSDPGGGGAKTYPVTFTGVVANNHTVYDAADLDRTVRYKIDNGSWIYIDNATVAALDSVTSFNIVVPVSSTATVEGWMTYHGLRSQVETIVISNTNQAGKIYGSVNGRTKELVKLYGSVNGRTKKLVKVYASVGGVAKKVYEDI